MSILSETIEKWATLVMEYEAINDHQLAEQVRNWLFGAGLALQILDDDNLTELSKRALEASENEHIRNRILGADPGDNLGISGMDGQREDLADGGAGR